MVPAGGAGFQTGEVEVTDELKGGGEGVSIKQYFSNSKTL